MSSQSDWEREGWDPLIVHEISAIPSAPAWCRIKGSYKGRGRDLFANSEEVPRYTLFHARVRGDDNFDISYFLIGEDQQIFVRNFIAVARASDMQSTQLSKQISSSEASVGPMADALGKAGFKKR